MSIPHLRQESVPQNLCVLPQTLLKELLLSREYVFIRLVVEMSLGGHFRSVDAFIKGDLLFPAFFEAGVVVREALLVFQISVPASRVEAIDERIYARFHTGTFRETIRGIPRAFLT